MFFDTQILKQTCGFETVNRFGLLFEIFELKRT